MNLVLDASGNYSTELSVDKHEVGKHAGHSVNIFKIKFWVALVLTAPIFLYSEMASEIFGIQIPKISGLEYALLALGSVVFFYCGSIFLTSAYREIRARLPGMMTLIAIAIITAYLYSVYSILFAIGENLLFELSSLITVMLLGHWLEMRAVSGAQSALKELSKLLPDTAEVIRNGVAETISLSELKKGDLTFVKPGGRIPADGVVKEGASDVNESIATGESKLIPKKSGDEVIAGTTNGDGSLKIMVTKVGEETFLAGVMRLVAEAQGSRSRLQILSDKAALYLTIVAVVSGGATLTAWLLVGASINFAVARLVAVLVIACPHALGLAVPLVASISTTKAAKNGFLIKQRLSLEAARNVQVVLFDKTGTLTRGEFGVEEIVPDVSEDESKILLYAASVNGHSEHPLAKAIIVEAKKRGVAIPEAKDFRRIPGKGVRASVLGREIFTGSMVLARDQMLVVTDELKRRSELFEKQGKTVNVVIENGRLLGIIALTDIVREESSEAVKTLHGLGIKTAMMTGDSEDVAKWVAGELGIDEYFARVLPEQKSEKVKFLQARGQKVAMVGDGVNDAPALAQADLGIAIGAGTNVAIESAGIILVRNDPRDIVKIIRLSRMTYSKMIQNLFWAAGYNIVAIPLAAGVLAHRGILLEPALAAVFMSLSTVIVAVNAVVFRNKTL